MAETKKDQWSWWREALAGKVPGLAEGEVQSGFYRKRVRKDGEFQAVSIWQQDGEFVCVFDSNEFGAGKTTNLEEITTIFSFACDNPITRDQFTQFRETRKWHDEAGRKIETSDSERDEEKETSNKEVILDDKEGVFKGIDIEGVPIEQLQWLQKEVLSRRKAIQQVEEKKLLYSDAETIFIKDFLEYCRQGAECEELLKKTVETEADASRIAHFTKSLDRFRSSSEANRKTFKEFPLVLGRQIDGIFGMVIDGFKKKSGELKSHLQPYLDKLEAEKRAEARRLKQEAEEKEADRIAKEREKQEAEDALKRADNQSDEVKEELKQKIVEAEDAVVDATKAEDQNKRQLENAKSNTNVGTTGSKVGLRKVKEAEVEDWGAAIMSLKDNQEFIQYTSEWMCAKAKKGMQIDGVRVFESTKVQ